MCSALAYYSPKVKQKNTLIVCMLRVGQAICKSSMKCSQLSDLCICISSGTMLLCELLILPYFGQPHSHSTGFAGLPKIFVVPQLHLRHHSSSKWSGTKFTMWNPTKTSITIAVFRRWYISESWLECLCKYLRRLVSF
jgi:hypothetical protein